MAGCSLANVRQRFIRFVASTAMANLISALSGSFHAPPGSRPSKSLIFRNVGCA